MKLTERDVTTQIRDYLEWHGWRALRNQVSVSQNQAGGWFRTGEKGMPDFLFLFYFKDQPFEGLALHLWIEMKQEHGKLSPEQIDWQMKELARGATVWTVDRYEPFVEKYEETFGWLAKHKTGQLILGDSNGESADT